MKINRRFFPVLLMMTLIATVLCLTIILTDCGSKTTEMEFNCYVMENGVKREAVNVTVKGNWLEPSSSKKINLDVLFPDSFRWYLPKSQDGVYLRRDPLHNLPYIVTEAYFYDRTKAESFLGILALDVNKGYLCLYRCDDSACVLLGSVEPGEATDAILTHFSGVQEIFLASNV